jgi:hypothetical protein
MKWKWKEHTLEQNRCTCCGREFPEAEGRMLIYTNPIGWIYRGEWTGAKEFCA